MKSLLITFDFPPIVSGISTYIHNIWKLLPSSDHLILAPKIKGYKKIDRNSPLKVTRYFMFSRSRIIRTGILILYTLTLIFKEKINILLCGAPLSLGFIGLLFKKILKMPYCVFYYGGEFEKYKRGGMKGRLLELILQNADYIIVNSEYTKKNAIKFRIDEKKVFKIMPGVDTEKFKPDLDISDLKKHLNANNKKVLLTVSRLVKRKGIDTVIRALPDIIRTFNNILYLIIGLGSEEDYLHSLAKEKGVDGSVVFCGSISDEELPRHYNLCDIYVMPNKETEGEEIVEGFGISFIEASACAKPVIGGISGGAKEAVLDGQTGLLVDPNDSQKLVGAILQFLKNEAYAVNLGRNGRKRVEKEFRWKDRSQKLQALLRKIV